MQVNVHEHSVEGVFVYEHTFEDKTADMAVWVIEDQLCLTDPDYRPINGTYVGIAPDVCLSDFPETEVRHI